MGRKCLWSKATDQAPDAKTDIAFCGQGGVLAGSDIRAANQDGAVRLCPLGNDVDIAAGFDGAATCAVAGLCSVALAFAGAQANGDGGSLGGIAANQRLRCARQALRAPQHPFDFRALVR